MAAGMTLGDLLSRPEYRELRQYTGGADALERPLQGIHSTEYEHPAEWVEPGWVILTLGFRLKRSPAAQRTLIAELDDAGVTALGLGLGSAFQAPPRAMLAEARKRGFPVFTIPLTTSFRDMIRDVYQALLSDDLRGYQRLVAMQHHLLDAFDDRHPQEAVLERLAALVGAPVAVVGPRGQVERSTGPVPGEEIWEKISTKPQTVMEFDVDEAQVVAVPVSRAASAKWLVAVPKSGTHRSAAMKHALRLTAPLLSAMLRLDEVAHTQEVEIKAALLAEFAEPSASTHLPSLVSRAAPFGINFTEPITVARFASRSSTTSTGDLVALLAGVLRDLPIAHLVRGTDDEALILLQGSLDRREEALAVCLTATQGDVVLATGRVVTRPEAVAASVADTALCLAELRATNGARTMHYEDLELDALLLSEVPYERVSDKVAGVLTVLDQNPLLRETIEAYFAHDLDVSQAAESLFLHPNSMRYRLRRIQEVLGRPLRAPATISMLHVALMSEQRQRRD